MISFVIIELVMLILIMLLVKGGRPSEDDKLLN